MEFSFSSWLAEWADFGFGFGPTKRHVDSSGEDPIHILDISYVTNLLKRHKLGLMEGNRRFVGEVVWGEDAGAIKTIFTPWGGSRCIIRKLVRDLDGESVWICKKVVELRHLFDTRPDVLIESLLSNLNEIAGEGLESASNTYDHLERLVMRLTGELRGTRRDLFEFEGIRRVKENEEYIIRFGVQGMGVQARGQRRIEEFLFHVVYKKSEGVIKIIGQEVESSLGQHKWALNESDWIEHYVPNQNMDEIIESQVKLFKSY